MKKLVLMLAVVYSTCRSSLVVLKLLLKLKLLLTL